jgi:hypothetical protein
MLLLLLPLLLLPLLPLLLLWRRWQRRLRRRWHQLLLSALIRSMLRLIHFKCSEEASVDHNIRIPTNGRRKMRVIFHRKTVMPNRRGHKCNPRGA